MVSIWDEAFLDDENLPRPPRHSLVQLEHKGLVKDGITKIRSQPGSPEGTLSAAGQRSSRFRPTPCSDSTACPGIDSPGAECFALGAQLCPPTQNIDYTQIRGHVDNVSLLAAAALGHRQAEGVGATYSPGYEDSTTPADADEFGGAFCVSRNFVSFNCCNRSRPYKQDVP